VKRAERGDGIVVRIYNTRDTAQTASLTFGLPFRAVAVVDLDEAPLAEHITAERLNVAADTLTCTLRPGEMLTLHFRL
jgi:alpha-mannosidase